MAHLFAVEVTRSAVAADSNAITHSDQNNIFSGYFSGLILFNETWQKRKWPVRLRIAEIERVISERNSCRRVSTRGIIGSQVVISNNSISNNAISNNAISNSAIGGTVIINICSDTSSDRDSDSRIVLYPKDIN